MLEEEITEEHNVAEDILQKMDTLLNKKGNSYDYKQGIQDCIDIVVLVLQRDKPYPFLKK